jgi:nitrate reductase gamma subunit
MHLLNQILFGIYPYIALSVLALGSVIRFDREQYTWRSGSSQLLRRKQLVLGSVLFHLGVLTIFAGHFVGLLTPIWVFDALGIPHGAKQILAMTAGGLAGVMCLTGGLMLLHRRLFDPRIRATSSFGDTAILILLMTQLSLGLATIPVSAGHLDGHEMLKFMAWAQGVFTFRPGIAELVADVHPIFKAHLVLGLTILLVFPFTRLVHMLSAPVWYLNRRGWQLVRTKRAMPLRREAAAPIYPIVALTTAQETSVQAAQPKTLKAAE